MRQKINLVNATLFVADRFADMIFFLDGVFVTTFFKLEEVCVDSFGISLVSMYSSINKSYNSLFDFLNSFAIVKFIKAVEDYANYEACNKIDISFLFNSKLMIISREIAGFLVVSYIIILSLLLFFAITKKDLENFQFYYSKFLNEIDNNLSNFKDVRNSAITFVFIINFFILMFSYLKYGPTVLVFFFFMLALNVKTIVVYLYFYNINLYVYIKGLLNKMKIFFNFIIDNITLSIFISRLMLQFIRLLICSAIFFLWHEMSITILDTITDYSNYLTLNKIYGFNLTAARFVIEYLDMIINFSSQYSIYIISVMWLIPFLFTFVKKVYKIKNK